MKIETLALMVHEHIALTFPRERIPNERTAEGNSRRVFRTAICS